MAPGACSDMFPPTCLTIGCWFLHQPSFVSLKNNRSRAVDACHNRVNQRWYLVDITPFTQLAENEREIHAVKDRQSMEELWRRGRMGVEAYWIVEWSPVSKLAFYKGLRKQGVFIEDKQREIPHARDIFHWTHHATVKGGLWRSWECSAICKERVHEKPECARCAQNLCLKLRRFIMLAPCRLHLNSRPPKYCHKPSMLIPR